MTTGFISAFSHHCSEGALSFIKSARNQSSFSPIHGSPMLLLKSQPGRVLWGLRVTGRSSGGKGSTASQRMGFAPYFVQLLGANLDGSFKSQQIGKQVLKTGLFPSSKSVWSRLWAKDSGKHMEGGKRKWVESRVRKQHKLCFSLPFAMVSYWKTKPSWNQTFMSLASGRVYLKKAPVKGIRFSPLAIKAFPFWWKRGTLLSNGERC